MNLPLRWLLPAGHALIDVVLLLLGANERGSAAAWLLMTGCSLPLMSATSARLAVSPVLWFLAGYYLERAPRPHCIGRSFLVFRAISIATILWPPAVYFAGWGAVMAWAAFTALTLRRFLIWGWRRLGLHQLRFRGFA